MEPTGDPLVLSLAEGREDAFAALYDRLGPALFRVALALLGSHQDAEDAVQEAFVGLVRARRTLAAVENLRAYVCTALRHTAARLGAARKAERPVASQALAHLPTPQSRELDVGRAAGLEDAIARTLDNSHLDRRLCCAIPARTSGSRSLGT